MIKLVYHYSKESEFIALIGHAGYAPKGHDILCAFVSGLYQNLLTGLDLFSGHSEVYDDETETGENIRSVTVYDRNNATTTLITTFLASMSILEKQYKKYIEIEERHN